MKVKIHSKHINPKLKAAVHAMCEWSLARMGVSSRIRNNLNLNIHFRHADTEGEALLDDETNPYRPRDFRIILDHHRKNLDGFGRERGDTEWSYNVLGTLGHELVHVKQHIKQELTERKGRFYWKGVQLKGIENILDYYDLPHEIEAYGREKGLLVGFLAAWSIIEEEFGEECDWTFK